MLTNNIQTTATLASTCQINSTNIDFGNIGGNATLHMSSAGAVNVLCSNKTSYTIRLNSGINNGSATTRYLVGSATGDKVVYAICKTASWSMADLVGGQCSSGPWYTQGGNDYPVTGVGTGATQSYPSYGFIESGYYSPDTYSDLITATITY